MSSVILVAAFYQALLKNGINEYLNCGDSFFLFYQLSSYQRLLQQLRKKEDAVEED